MTEKSALHWLVQKVRCRLGRHDRNAKMARKRGERWYSFCNGCRVELVKPQEDSKWMRVDDFHKARGKTRRSGSGRRKTDRA